MLNIPKWVWFVLWAMVLLVVLVLLKFNFSIGSDGIHFTQHLIGQ